MNALVEMSEQEIRESSLLLLKIFEDFSEEDEYGARLVSDMGLEAMSTYYGTIPYNQRGMVFISFLSDLYDSGHCYNMQQFLDMEEVEDDGFDSDRCRGCGELHAV